MRLLGRALVTATVISCAGCGGDGGPDTFVEKANAACEKRIERAQATRDDDGLAERTETRARIAAVRAQQAELRALEAPPDRRQKFAQMRSLYDESIRLEQRAIRLIERAQRLGRDPDPSDVLRAANAARVRGNALAREIGLDVCGTRFE
jgi:hypothetical protein